MTIQFKNPDQWPAPGVYRNIPFAQYCTLDAANASGLKVIAARSLADYRHQQLYPKDSTALDEGRAFHTFILEPDRVWREYSLSQQCVNIFGAKAKNAGQQCSAPGKFINAAGQWQCGKHCDDNAIEPKNIISEDLHDRLKRMHNAIWSHPVASKLLDPTGRETELSCIWVDPATGLLCKMRIDALRYEQMIIADLKKSLSIPGFEAQANALNYPLQGAHYLEGAKHCFGPGMWLFKFIAVEDDANQEHGGAHNPCVFTLGPDAWELGEMQRRDSLAALAIAKKTDSWPGYTQERILECTSYKLKKEKERQGL